MPGCGLISAYGAESDVWRAVFVDEQGAFRVEFNPVEQGVLRVIDGAATSRITASIERHNSLAKEPLKYYCRIAAGEDWNEEALRAVGEAFPKSDENTPDAAGIPAAYTYLGQFIAHDLSSLGVLDGNQTEVRTSALDLDGLFRAGSTAENRGESWIGGVGVGKLDVGEKSRTGGCDIWSDIARNANGSPRMPDPRNNGNLGVQQIHVAIARFHQTVAQTHRGLDIEDQERITRQHIQALVLGDYFEKVIDDRVRRDLFERGRRVIHPGTGAIHEEFLVPIEFAGAAFRVGHSMIRQKYPGWNPNPSLDGLLTHLISLARIPSRLRFGWEMPWERVHWSESDANTVAASALDLSFAPSLDGLTNLDLPDFATHNPAGPIQSLATLSMVRHEHYELASAQTLIREINRMLDGVCTIPEIKPDELLSVAGGHFACIIEDHDFHNVTPLYLYCLLESQKNGGQKMGPLTSRIVAETLHAAIAASQDTILANGRTSNFVGDPLLGTDVRFGFGSLIDVVANLWQPEI